MLLPNRKNAFISPEKITDYLLSTSHVLGQFKARFFRGHGYLAAHRLAHDLLDLAQNHPVVQEIPSPYGTKYIIRGKLVTPKATTIEVETVWIIEPEQHRPRLVTAYPA